MHQGRRAISQPDLVLISWATIRAITITITTIQVTTGDYAVAGLFSSKKVERISTITEHVFKVSQCNSAHAMTSCKGVRMAWWRRHCHCIAVLIADLPHTRRDTFLPHLQTIMLACTPASHGMCPRSPLNGKFLYLRERTSRTPSRYALDAARLSVQLVHVYRWPSNIHPMPCNTFLVPVRLYILSPTHTLTHPCTSPQNIVQDISRAPDPPMPEHNIPPSIDVELAPILFRLHADFHLLSTGSASISPLH